MHPSSFLGALVGVWRMVAELFSRPWFVFIASLVGSLCITFGPWFIKQVCGGLPGLHIMTVHSLTTPCKNGDRAKQDIVFSWWSRAKTRHQRVAFRGLATF